MRREFRRYKRRPRHRHASVGNRPAAPRPVEKDREKISGLGRAAASGLQVHHALLERPIATSGSLVEKTGLTPATVNKALVHL